MITVCSALAIGEIQHTVLNWAQTEGMTPQTEGMIPQTEGMTPHEKRSTPEGADPKKDIP